MPFLNSLPLLLTDPWPATYKVRSSHESTRLSLGYSVSRILRTVDRIRYRYKIAVEADLPFILNLNSCSLEILRSLISPMTSKALDPSCLSSTWTSSCGGVVWAGWGLRCCWRAGWRMMEALVGSGLVRC